MEIYYTSKIKGKAGTVAAWSKAPGWPPLLAVSLSPNAIGVYTEEGRPFDPNNEYTIKNVRGSECVKLAWHPLLPLLAIAWKDGAVSFWNAEERRLEEDSKTHRTVINCLVWSVSGDRLTSADDNGKLAMWKTDRRMCPIHVVSFDEPGCKIRACILGPVEMSMDSGTPITSVYYGVNAGGKTVIKWANDQGYAGMVQEMSDEVHSLIYYAEKEQLLVVTAGCMLNVLGKDESAGCWTSVMKMKFATGTGEAATSLQVVWAGHHTLASSSERDNVVRMYNFDTDDNFVLTPEAAEGTGNVTKIIALAYDARYDMLVAGTTDGRVTVFKHTPTTSHDPMFDLARTWDMQPAFQVGSRALFMELGPTPRLMTVVCADAVHVCRKTLLNHRFRDGFVVIQAGVERLTVESLDSSSPKALGHLTTADMQILGLDFSKGTLLTYDGTRAMAYKVSPSNDCTPAGGFETSSRALALMNESIYRTAENRLEVCNMAGTVKQTLPFDDTIGSPVLLDICRDYLAATTTRNMTRVFKVAGREAKVHAGPGHLIPSELAKQLTVEQVKVNGTGTMVAALVSSTEKSRDQRMFVWCSETNTTLTYDFAKDSRVPQVMAWDPAEPKLLAVQTLAVPQEDLMETSKNEPPALEVAIMFVSHDHGILMQEYQDLDSSGATGFVGISAPYLILHKKPQATGKTTPGTAQGPFSSSVARVLMQGFAGIQEDDEDKTKRALLDFSFNLAIGNMDDAFRAVKQIKNSAVWENLAHLCIKNKRLDVAEHCLSNMEHARGARALREAKSIEELDARVATVAVHLGMMDDAKKLYLSCERYDLLNQLYRASGQWDKALDVAEKNDRIHLKATHYAYAQYLEKSSEFAAALTHYESSGTQFLEVPRMLFEAGRVAELEKYVVQKDSRELLTWWARYCESQSEFQKALDCYEKAGDGLSIVRIHCFKQDFAAAEEQVARLGDPAAAFHLARQYEVQDRITEAVRYYTLAKRYSHGVRLAKKHDLDGELMNLALKSTPVVMIDTADYLNEKGEYEKAATLYMKGGKLRKAVEMCFNANLFDVLQHITDDLKEDADPALFLRCAEFFMENGHFDKATRMLIAAKQFTRALELCLEHEVAITEETAESMTPDKASMSSDERNQVLQRIAKACKRQGNFHLACKKYTQAGEKIKAMKALLRSGDTEKIVFFAGVSRQKEIYMMAANYLQTLDWHSDPEVMKNIITFYTKAAAMDSLAAFYEACAQIEIDEYRDYEKALQAMREALKYSGKSKTPEGVARVAGITQRIQMAETFVQARTLIQQNAREALALCDELLATIPSDGQDVEAGIRVGDVFALMIEYWYEQRNAEEAYRQIEKMRARNIILNPYLDAGMVQDVYKAIGIEPPEERVVMQPIKGNVNEEDMAFVEEDVIDEPMDD